MRILMFIVLISTWIGQWRIGTGDREIVICVADFLFGHGCDQVSRLMILFQCQSMVSLIARQRLSMLLIWYNVVVREDDSGKGATRQCSRCSGLESAITTDHCSPIVVPHPPSRCLRIRRRREVGSRFTSRQVDESFRGVCQRKSKEAT